MNDKINQNPLQELFTDASGYIEPGELLAILKSYIGINRQKHTIIFTPEGLALNASKKIILLLLGRKALKLLSIVESEAISPKEMKDEFGRNMPSGTIDSTVKRLSDQGYIQGEEGKYFVPDFIFPKIKEFIYGKK